MTQPMTTAEQILDAQRFARASHIVEGTCAYDDNECRLDTDKPTPRYLVLEYGSMPDDIRNFWQDETFADAARNIDCSETDDVRIASVVDLDTGIVYEADRRTVGFNNMGSHEDLPDVPDTDEPMPARINIAPANLSTFQPAPYTLLNDHETALIVGRLDGAYDTPRKAELLDRINREALAFAQPPTHPLYAIVTVSGGVAEVAEQPAGVSVHVLDFDNLKETMNDADAEKERTGTLPTNIILTGPEEDYLRRTDPAFLAEVEPYRA